MFNAFTTLVHEIHLTKNVLENMLANMKFTASYFNGTIFTKVLELLDSPLELGQGFIID